VERSTGEMLIGPPKSKAGRRIVGIPAVIVAVLREHLAVFAEDEPGALVFPGAKGGPLRRGNFDKMSAWPHAVESIGMTGLHFHDLRHTGNQFAAQSGVRLRDLMARMGPDSERAALIHQHQAQGADKAITNAIDTHVQARRRLGRFGRRPGPGWLTARTVLDDPRLARSGLAEGCPTCGYAVVRVTGIEPALSAWESSGNVRAVLSRAIPARHILTHVQWMRRSPALSDKSVRRT